MKEQTRPIDTKKVAATKASQLTGRVALIGAVGVIVTYLLSLVLPNMPEAVVAAVITLIGVGIDNYQHRRGSKVKLPF